MPEITFAVILFNSFPEAIVLAYLGLSLLGVRTGLRPILLIGGLQTLFSVLLFFGVGRVVVIPFGIHTVIQAVVLAVIIQRVMQLPYKSCCLATLLGFGIYLCVESSMIALFIFVTGYATTVILSNWWLRMAFFIWNVLFSILIVFLIRRCNLWLTDRWEAVESSKFLWVAALLFTQSLLAILFCWKCFLPYKDLFSPIYFYIYLVASVVLPIITVAIIGQFATLIKNEVESKAQLDTLRHTEELLYTMRAQRHDFSQELQVVYGLLEVAAFQEAKEYLQKSVAEVAATAELVKTDNMGITALLYTKTGLAEARKIALQIMVETSLCQLPLEARDVSLILGNLIDNALDAVEPLPSPDRKVEVVITQGLEGYVFTVKNGGPPIPLQVIARIFMPGFSTKGEGRGMGLYSIQKLVQKHRGNIRVTSDSKGTVFRIVIPSDL